MKLTVFGNNATCPEADGACSCYLLQTKGKRILLDMGNGSAAKLQKHLPLTQLDAIIISHLHFDHFGDLFCAKYALETKRAYGENLKPIPLFIPALPQWASEELCTNDVFQIHTIKDGAAYDFDEVHFSFFAVKHLIESYGVRISAEGKTFAFLCKILNFCKNKTDKYFKIPVGFGAGGRTRTGTPSLAVDFESTTSTNSITPASRCYYTA